mgnify:CR=1 FL=1|jgi:hypothetical protein
MFGDDILAAQKSLLADVYVKGRKDFMCCRKSQFYKPELVILNSGRFYVDRGLSTCKRILYCAECNKAYLWKKSLLMKKVEEYVQQENLTPTMITLTIPHKLTDKLADLRTKLDKATRNFLSARTNKLMKGINQSVGNEGYIYRNDITYNENSGWNPHCHIVQLNKISYSENQKNELADEFARQLEQAGLYLNRFDKLKLQVNFADNFTSLNYLTKYNQELMELAITNSSKYIELATSGNNVKIPPLIAFKKGLMTKLNLSAESEGEVVDRVSLPESMKNLSAKEIAQYALDLI